MKDEEDVLLKHFSSNVKKAQEFVVREIEKEESKENKKTIKTIFEDLNDFIVQEIWSNGPKLLIWDKRDGKVNVCEEFEWGNIVYKPHNIPIGRKGRPLVTLASKPIPYRNEKDLLERIREFIDRYSDLEPWALEFTSRFVMHSWVYDMGDYAIQLWIKGLTGSGKTRFLKLLALLCYNALYVGGNASFSAYKRLISKYRGTLLINEFELKDEDDSNEVIIWLNNGFEKDNEFPLSRKNQPEKQDFFDPFGPKVIASRSLISNPATLSRMVVIEMHKTSRKDIPIKLPAEAYREAEEIRNMLLFFRLKHYKSDYALRSDLDERLRNDEVIDGRFKQQAYPMLELYEIAGLDVNEVFNFYRKLTLDFKKRQAESTPEGVIFHAIMELCSLQDCNNPDFSGHIVKEEVKDETGQEKKVYGLVGITTRLLEDKTGFSKYTITKALSHIGMVQERRKTKVIIYDLRGDFTERTRYLRLWKFKSERTWKEALDQYYVGDVSLASGTTDTFDTLPIPEILKSRDFNSEKMPENVLLNSTNNVENANKKSSFFESPDLEKDVQVAKVPEVPLDGDTYVPEQEGKAELQSLSPSFENLIIRSGSYIRKSLKDFSKYHYAELVCQICNSIDEVFARKVSDTQIAYLCDECVKKASDLRISLEELLEKSQRGEAA